MKTITKKTVKHKKLPPILTELIIAYIEDCRNIGVIALDVRAILSLFSIAFSQERIKKALADLANSRKIYLKVGGSQNVFIIVDAKANVVGN